MHDPLFSDPKRLLLDMAQERSVEELLRMVVTRISDTRRVALARIWLAQPTSECRHCSLLDACRAQSRCLQLVASGGRSVVDSTAEWSGVEGMFQRIPFGMRKVGRIAASGEPIEVPDLADPLPEWVARPEWIRAEGISGFAGQPLVCRGEVLGVLAVFARGSIGPECMGWLRMIADHAAAALMSARAFAEIE